MALSAIERGKMVEAIVTGLQRVVGQCRAVADGVDVLNLLVAHWQGIGGGLSEAELLDAIEAVKGSAYRGEVQTLFVTLRAYKATVVADVNGKILPIMS